MKFKCRVTVTGIGRDAVIAGENNDFNKSRQARFYLYSATHDTSHVQQVSDHTLLQLIHLKITKTQHPPPRGEILPFRRQKTRGRPRLKLSGHLP